MTRRYYIEDEHGNRSYFADPLPPRQRPPQHPDKFKTLRLMGLLLVCLALAPLVACGGGSEDDEPRQHAPTPVCVDRGAACI